MAPGSLIHQKTTVLYVIFYGLKQVEQHTPSHPWEANESAALSQLSAAVLRHSVYEYILFRPSMVLTQKYNEPEVISLLKLFITRSVRNSNNRSDLTALWKPMFEETYHFCCRFGQEPE